MVRKVCDEMYPFWFSGLMARRYNLGISIVIGNLAELHLVNSEYSYIEIYQLKLSSYGRSDQRSFTIFLSWSQGFF